ncbi:MAG: DUF58 domain-containing protein [Chloroflexi bacterium]|nr:DUF58 domain-containing protein [Chloroflexota bacterium]
MVSLSNHERTAAPARPEPVEGRAGSFDGLRMGGDAGTRGGRFRDLPAPTLRLYLLALGLALPLGLGELAPAFLGLAAAGAVALLAAVLADHAAAVRPGDLEVERQHHPRLYLAADNPVELVVANRARRAVVVRLRETPPSAFRSSALFFEGTVGPAARVAFRYTTRPTARGLYRFSTLTLRWRTPLGLLWRQHTLPLDEEVAVYPNLLEVQKYDLLARKGLLREMGLRSARLLGRGTEFESLRDYQPDDDVRRVNWKATARRHRPITTLYETERSQRLIVLLDLGRMMLTRVGELTRLDAAVNTALLLCYVALARGDRVGLLSFADGVHAYTPPRRGRAHFYRIVEQLYAVSAQPVESDYVGAFTRLRSDLRARALVALFTDLSDPDVARTIARHLALLARHHLPLCVAISDPAVQARADAIPQVGRELYEKVVAARLLDERTAVLDELRRAGVLTVDTPANQLTPATINRYLELKARALL